MNKIRLFQVDAFSDKQFKGNPAVVCLLYDELPENSMLAIAAENNVPATAFVVKRDDGFGLRWFTPSAEIKLCGHATLATAYILWREGLLPAGDTVRFYTQSGVLTAVQSDGWIELDFPASLESHGTLPAEALAALNVKPLNVVFSESRFIVELASAEEVQNCAPDFKVLKNYDGVVITSRGASSSKYDFISRTFYPSNGIDEDPVTGSSHCCLAPYWAKRLNKTEMFAYQASARGGEIKVKFSGERVLFSGKAVTVVEGFFLLA